MNDMGKFAWEELNFNNWPVDVFFEKKIIPEFDMKVVLENNFSLSEIRKSRLHCSIYYFLSQALEIVVTKETALVWGDQSLKKLKWYYFSLSMPKSS